MATIPRLGLQYPDEGDDPYFDRISSFFAGLDTFIFANMADRNMFLWGGGTLSFNSTSGAVTWTSPLLLIDLVSGFSVTIAASTITLADGQCAYVDTDRSLSGNVTALLTAAAFVGNGAGKIAVFLRKGTKLVFRNGLVFQAGNSGSFIESGGADVRSGVVLFDGTNDYVDVTFSAVYADTTYRYVGLVCDGGFALYAPTAQKATSGFRIATTDASVPGAGIKAYWKTERV